MSSIFKTNLIKNIQIFFNILMASLLLLQLKKLMEILHLFVNLEYVKMVPQAIVILIICVTLVII